MSVHELGRVLGLPYKTAWSMAHRIREGMQELDPGPMEGSGKIAETDETFVKSVAGKRFFYTRSRGGQVEEAPFEP